jgi:hypothetical protein
MSGPPSIAAVPMLVPRTAATCPIADIIRLIKPWLRLAVMIQVCGDLSVESIIAAVRIFSIQEPLMPRERRDPKLTRAAVVHMTRVALAANRGTSEYQFVIREILKTLIFKYTEAVKSLGDKYLSCEVWSEQAHNRYLKDGATDLNLEHVVSRKWLNQALHASHTDAIRNVFEKSDTCVVTQKEHAKLPRLEGEAGWMERYAKTKVARLTESYRLAMKEARNHRNNQLSTHPDTPRFKLVRRRP